MRVLIVCSSGGHLAQAWALRDWWGRHERVWVTLPTDDARARLAGERMIEGHYPTVRNIPNLMRNTKLAGQILQEARPNLVFSTGAAISVPFFLMAHRFGARTAYLEPVDRIDSPSMTGRLVYPFADEFFVQWQALEGFFPGCTNVGVVL